MYTIIAIAGDNGMAYAIGRFSSIERASELASTWTERDNPDRDIEGLSYQAVRIQTIANWEAE